MQAHCPKCNAQVTVCLLLSQAELRLALDGDGEVKVLHVPDAARNGSPEDHIWSLSENEKTDLRTAIAKHALLGWPD